MDSARLFNPTSGAPYRADRMGKSTLYESPRILVGLNAFEAGQEHALHAHAGMDKVYSVVDGEGLFLLDGRELPAMPGDVLIAPEGVPHGIRNPGPGRLLLLAVLAPAPDSVSSGQGASGATATTSTAGPETR